MEQSALTELATRKIFAAVQQAGDAEEGPDTGGDAELVYSEFLESLAAVSCFKMCNPYMPLDQRYGVACFVTLILFVFWLVVWLFAARRARLMCCGSVVGLRTRLETFLRDSVMARARHKNVRIAPGTAKKKK